MRKTEEDQSAKLVRVITGVLLGGVLALGVCLVFLFLCAVGVSGGRLSEDLMDRLAIVGCVVGGFAGGIFAVRRCGAGPLLAGLAAGAVLFLLLLTIGSLCFENVPLGAGGIGRLWASLCGGAAAGLLGSGKKKAAPRKKRRK